MTQPDKFSIRAWKNTSEYGHPIYAVFRNGKLIGELYYDGGRWKNAGGPAWAVRVFTPLHTTSIYGGRDYRSALEALKESGVLTRVTEDQWDRTLRSPLVYQNGKLRNP